MSESIKISDAEWEVMKVLWQKAPRTANEIVEAISDAAWSPPTVKTFVNRLVKKGAVRFEKSGREYLFYPVIEHQTYARQEQRSFVQRVYDGAVHPIVANLLEDEHLTREDLDELRRMLDKRRRELK